MSTVEEQFYEGIDKIIDANEFLEKVAVPRYRKEAHDAYDELIEVKQQFSEYKSNNSTSSTKMQLYLDKVLKTIKSSSVDAIKEEFEKKNNTDISEHDSKSGRRGRNKNK